MEQPVKTDITSTTQVLQQVIQSAIEHHGAGRDAVIPILGEINEALGYIPGEALGIIRRMINTPDEGLFLADSHLFSTASFYQMFSLEKLGKHVVHYCSSAPCYVEGGHQLIEALKERLGIEPGQTRSDMQWTLLRTSCLGVCAVGPVIIIDQDIYGNVTPERLDIILARYED